MPPSITDLFDKVAPVQVDFDLCKMWHPRFCFREFSTPPWLMKYKIVHFHDHHQVWTRTVHKLYHEVLDNETDRLLMSKAIDAGENFAILRPEGTNNKNSRDPVAVAAITFANIGRKVIVLLLAVDERHRDAGFGSQLLKLAGQCLMYRGLQNISMFLLANQQNNEKAWSFYTRRGFQLSSDDIVEAIPEFVNHPTFGEFTHMDDVEQLRLLWLKSFEHDFILGPSTIAKAPMLFLLNPQRPMHGEIDDPMIYARFPGDLSLSQCNHCGKDLVLFHHAEVFQEVGDATAESCVGISEGFPKSQFVVSWRSRTEITTGVTILNPVISMLLAWIQRDGRARIWKERVTLVPPCVMMPLWNMHFLFQRFLQARMYKDDDFADIRNATFHPKFDEERFLEHLKVVLEYIIENGDDLFDKPYLVMFGENLNMDWTCFISVNASAIQVGPAPSDECDYTLGEEVCGFINYDPNAEDDVFQCTPLHGDDPYLFFLTLAHHVLTVDSDVRLSFSNMDDFLSFFNQAPISYGERYQESLNERTSFNGDHFFVQLALPLKYPLRLISRMEHLSKLAAILFFIDFCVSVAITHDFHWGNKGNLAVINKPLAESQKFVFRIPSAFPFGRSLSHHLSVSKATMNRKDLSFRSKFGSSSRRIINASLSSMMVLIDRIACSGEGERRTSRMEYKKFLANRGKHVPDLTSLPAPGVRFTDRCQVLNWRPVGAIDSGSLYSSDCHRVEVNPPPAGQSGCSTRPDTILDDARSADGRSSDSEFEFHDGTISEDNGTSREDEPICGRVPLSLPDAASPHCDASKDGTGLVLTDTESQVEVVEGLLGLSELAQGLEPLQVRAPQGDDPRLSQLRAGQLVPLELDLSYEGFHEGSDAARPVEEVAQAIHRMGSLPQITHQPQVLEAMPHPSKRLRYSKPRSNEFVAVGPMVKGVAKARTTRQIAIEVLEKADLASICVNGDACLCPGGSPSLIDLEKCAPCSECKLIGHYICLRKRRNLRLCTKCFPVIHRLAQERARESLLARKARLQPFHLPPPPELLQVDKFVRPNIASKMANCLDEEMQIRGFSTAREMRAKIAEHNSKLDHLRNNPDSLSTKEQLALKKADMNMTRLCNEWKKCHARLRREYLRDTRCCVKELSYDSKRALFIANMEWEEAAVDKVTGEEIQVVNTEKLPVRDEWVKKNFKEGTYNYLKIVAKMSVGKFLPVPHAEIMMDTRQVSHYKWSQSMHHPEGRWIVKFSNSDDMEEMKESDLLAAVGEGSMNLAKAFAKGKGGFLPIPVGNSTGARAVEVISNIEILFRQHRRNTCIFSSFASALWFLGIRDVALVVVSRTEDSDGDPLALKRLAMLVHDHPSWLTPKKIKNASTFNLLEHDLSSSLAVVVLKGIPDGASNHAITVHDGLIFDSNEQFAIPLTKSNLDLMCSTDNRKAKYQCISAGYLFTDSRNGKNGIRDSRMEASLKV